MKIKFLKNFQSDTTTYEKDEIVDIEETIANSLIDKGIARPYPASKWKDYYQNKTLILKTKERNKWLFSSLFVSFVITYIVFKAENKVGGAEALTEYLRYLITNFDSTIIFVFSIVIAVIAVNKFDFITFLDIDSKENKRFKQNFVYYKKNKQQNYDEPSRPSTLTFESYYEYLSQFLESKSKISDQKASLLLSRGIYFTVGGIIFFLISIFAWQYLAYINNSFKTQYIYGIASCSFLFIFIEFLSAWFLKQYRHFVDTSTYLIKVKSIFDRYILAYLAISNCPDSQHTNNSHYNYLFNLLSEEIKWPDKLMLDKADVSFAKEAMEAMASAASALKDAAKPKNKEKKNIEHEGEGHK